MSDYDTNLFSVAGNTANTPEMGAGFEVYPDGEYPAFISTVPARVATKDGNSSFIQCDWQFFGCPIEGKTYTSRLNLWNTNQKTVEIAVKEVAAMRKAMGLSESEPNPASYVNKPVVLVLKVTNKKVNGVATADLQNQLVSIKPYTHQQQAAPPPAQQQWTPPAQHAQPQTAAAPATWQPPAQQAPPANAAKVPWKR